MKPLNVDQIIVDHARKPREYHTWFIVFLLSVIAFCVTVILVKGL
jgi:hypothetical protein